MFNPGCDFELDKKLSYICDSKTIGHWTDWNGNPDSEYMVVGQDWGTKKYLEKFCVSKRDNTALPYSSTDKNLAVCVKALNSEWDILKSDGIEKNDRYPLYFTNEILCYKDEEKMNAPISGGVT